MLKRHLEKLQVKNDYCVFILTHGRPDNVITYYTLKACGYTGPVYLILDNEDKTAEQYKARFGDKVIIFNKETMIKKTDSCDNFNDRRAAVYARNACFQIAKEIGYKYFIELDDDYSMFSYRYIKGKTLTYKTIKDLNKVFDWCFEYYKNISAHAIALSQGGDFIGGSLNKSIKNGFILIRKAMNVWFCSTDRQFEFRGRMNDDVNTYVNLGSQGKVFLTLTNISISNLPTQSIDGGMAEFYRSTGTYVKSFYTILFNPSSVRIMSMGSKYKRIHHKILWNYTVPKLLHEKWKAENGQEVN